MARKFERDEPQKKGRSGRGQAFSSFAALRAAGVVAKTAELTEDVAETEEDEDRATQKAREITEARQKIRERLKLANFPRYSGAIPRSKKAFSLTPGLHLIVAPARTGKSITGLAIADWLGAAGVNTSYQNAYEPDSDPEFSIQNLTVDFHTKLLRKHFDAVDPETAASGDEAPPASRYRGAVVFDSLSLALRMLNGVEALSKLLGDQAWKGGLKAADLIGAAYHNAFAMKHGVALIGTINQEMLPVALALKGTIRGVHMLNAPGIFTGDDRTDRVLKTKLADREYLNDATQAIGYGAYGTHSEDLSMGIGRRV